ncbi:MAG TPA: DUF541 domain-containing protein, partial [Actinobacteria bacterium]|nr:DUF541 domain-containing protein [Actinomycetota bacterium]
MRRNGLVALVAVVAVVGAACAGATPQVVVESAPAGGTETGIVVTGTGEAAGTPDTLTVTLGVSVLRGSVNEAITAAAERADALLDALRTAGVADRDLQTANYSIFPEYDYTGETQRLRGYRVTNTVVAKIRDLPRAGEILDAATRVAGDEVVVHGLSFSIEDDSALVVDARAKAFEEARAKAEQLASLAGVELG